MYFQNVFRFFQRALIVSGQGTTKHFSRGGAFINQFPSHLPGGCRKQRTWKQSHALLDAIYVETSRTYYILDIMYTIFFKLKNHSFRKINQLIKSLLKSASRWIKTDISWIRGDTDKKFVICTITINKNMLKLSWWK